jgi:hypothetical protein
VSKKIMELVGTLVDEAKLSGIKAERERILKVLNDKRATYADKAVWSTMSPEVSEAWVNKVEELDKIINAIERDTE